MKHKLKATLAALAGMALLAAIFALPALAQSGVDEPWTNDMNQESYWETRFGGDCTKFENHSGSIPAGYDAAVVKDGTQVRVYDPAPTPFTALGPVNPANGKHFDPPHSWVMKCQTTQVTTTSSSTSSTSSTSSSTTSSSTSTTSTSQDTTTTTAVDATTTTTDTTSTAPSSPPTTPPTELPFTGFAQTLWIVAGLVGLTTGGLIVRLTRGRA